MDSGDSRHPCFCCTAVHRDHPGTAAPSCLPTLPSVQGPSRSAGPDTDRTCPGVSHLLLPKLAPSCTGEGAAPRSPKCPPSCCYGQLLPLPAVAFTEQPKGTGNIPAPTTTCPTSTHLNLALLHAQQLQGELEHLHLRMSFLFFPRQMVKG